MRIALVLAILMTLARAADAHVVVLPDQSDAAGWERYVVLVPTEKESPTVRVEVRLPNGLDMIAVESKPGWEGHYEPFPVGASRVEWKGGRIPSGTFVSFEFLAWNPPAPRVIEWQATQWYEDGSSDRWGGGGPDDHHSSRTTLKPSTEAKGGMHRHNAPPPAKAGSKP
jgi:uncharacterized protein YcnI